MFDNLFPLLGQLVTTALVGGLFGGALAVTVAQIAASARRPHAHAPRGRAHSGVTLRT